MHTSCTNAARKHAKIRMVWLDILLPQRSVSDMIGAVSQILTRLRRSEIELPAFSVTSSLSSLMNGGKDFFDWNWQNDLLYRTKPCARCRRAKAMSVTFRRSSASTAAARPEPRRRSCGWCRRICRNRPKGVWLEDIRRNL